MSIDFKLPELGENVAGGDVLRVSVAAGDTITKEQVLLELETDKATIEVPSSVAGRVVDVKVKAGDKVKVGQVILTVDDASAAAASAAAPVAAPVAAAPVVAAPAAPAPGAPASPPPAAVPVPSAPPNAPRTSAPAAAARAPSGEATRRPQAGTPGETSKVVDITRGTRPAVEPQAPSAAPAAPAAPSVRRLARELGLDINDVRGTGKAGRISIDDVKAQAKRVVEGADAVSRAVSSEALPDFSRWGTVERQPMRAVRRKTAEHLSVAWATVPHVTQQALADITALEDLRKQYAKQAEDAGGTLTITAIAVKVAAAALKVFPHFNASIDLAAGEIVIKKYVNIGVAVDTDRGLLVPVIHDADTKNLIQLSVELTQLSEKARTRKISLDEMQGGCFSISNLGGIGGSFFTPIVNVPEVAILGISRARTEPVYDKESGAFLPRLMLPLSLSYDHRVIDGADGARFLKWVVEAFEQPFLLALEG